MGNKTSEKELFKQKRKSLLNFLFLTFLPLVSLWFLLSTSTAHASGITQPKNNLGLVGYWSFNDGTSTLATDFSGHGNTGTLTGSGGSNNLPQWLGGKQGKGLNFDGSDDMVSAGTSASLEVQSHTLSAWVNGADFSCPSGTCIIASKSGSIGSGGVEWGIRDSVLALAYYDGGVRGWYQDSTTLSLNTWYHVVIAWNQSAGEVKFYVNGTLSSTVPTTSGTISYAGDTFVIGKQSQNPFWSGNLDDLRIYNRVLGATEITALYNSGSVQIGSSLNTFMTNGLVGLWSFDGSDLRNTTAYERSGQGSNGTLSGAGGPQVNPQPVRGRIGQGLKFDSTDDYISVGTGTYLENTTPFTLAWWEKITNDSPTSPGRLYLKVQNGASGFDVLRTNSVGSYGNLVWGGAGCRMSQSVPTTADSVGVWHHFVLVGLAGPSSVTSADYRVYADGVNYSVAASCGGWADFGSNAVNYIGYDTAHETANAILDDIRIYNRALSATEAAQLYRAGTLQVGTSLPGTLDTTNLVLWHTFDGQKLNNTTSTDSSTRGNDGSLGGSSGLQVNPQPVRGKIGQALRFDGTDDTVGVNDSSSLELDDYITASAWVYPTNSLNSYRMIIVKRGACSTVNYEFYTFNGELRFFLGNNEYLTGYTLALNTWQYVAVTFDDTTNSLKFYVNGAEVNSQNATDAMTANSEYILIGGVSGLCNAFWQGSIDDVRIYNRVLSATEVRQIYDSTK